MSEGEYKPPTLEQAVQSLRGNPHFNVICAEMVYEREALIRGLAAYTDDVHLRKAAAEISAFSWFLDRFGVPLGEPPPLI